jgi:hypothetical protein
MMGGMVCMLPVLLGGDQGPLLLVRACCTLLCGEVTTPADQSVPEGCVRHIRWWWLVANRMLQHCWVLQGFEG